MKTKQIFTVLTILSGLLFASMNRAADITATNSGNWSDTNIWNSGTVPGTNDDADIPLGINVTVNTNASVQFIYDSGTVTMAPNSTLTILGDQAIDKLTSLVATATGNTVVYLGNPFFARQCNYYNLVFANTNYVDPYPPYNPYQNFNNFSSSQGPTPMTVAGNMTVIGYTKMQQGSAGADIFIGGNLIIGTNCIWDSSGANLTVVSNVFIGGLLEDLNGALGSNYFGGNVTVNPSATGGWNVSDVTQWAIGGSLTNNGPIFGVGYGSISFDGTGIITGSKPITIPTITVNGTYTIGTTITLATNTPTLNGTLVFDLANTNQIILNAGTNWLYYSGILDVINSGAAPVAGNSYKLFNAPNYGGSFTSTSFPSLPSGLNWVDNLATSGSIAVTGSSTGSPIITLSRSGNLLTLSWASTTFPGYSVQAQTNSAGIRSNWSATGSGTVSPYTITINPANPPVFFRLSNP
ncbi:MAG TPA: hypothetical protein DCQ92_10775 [Verrucomicrobia subdivision 3 bacterium]|nr:hypothetical protein [Limisphaerales bacterium]